MIVTIMVLVCAYLVGAIPVGYMIARARGVSDIRGQGSGNIGATNVARVLGFKYFFLVFFLDSVKAYLFLILAAWYGLPEQMLLFAGGALLVGNAYSPFLGFSGGKGVSTAVGIIAALAPYLLVGILFPWAILLLLTRTMGVANVGASLCLPFFSLLMYGEALIFYGSLCIAGWILARHLPNMRDYFRGTSTI